MCSAKFARFAKFAVLQVGFFFVLAVLLSRAHGRKKECERWIQMLSWRNFALKILFPYTTKWENSIMSSTQFHPTVEFDMTCPCITPEAILLHVYYNGVGDKYEIRCTVA